MEIKSKHLLAIKVVVKHFHQIIKSNSSKENTLNTNNLRRRKKIQENCRKCSPHLLLFNKSPWSDYPDLSWKCIASVKVRHDIGVMLWCFRWFDVWWKSPNAGAFASLVLCAFLCNHVCGMEATLECFTS